MNPENHILKKEISGYPSLKAVDFFCGAGGMSYGLMKAGIKVIAGLDVDESCRRTYEYNVKKAKFLVGDVTLMSSSNLSDRLKINPLDDSMIFTGCSPCQFWSKINTDKTKSRQSAYLLKEFMRFIEDLRPGWVVIENVPGIVSKKGSALPAFLSFLSEFGYVFEYSVLDLSRYDIPQSRHRFVLIANRLGISPSLPDPSTKPPATVRNFIGKANGFECIRAGHKDETDFMHTASGLSAVNLSRILKTPVDGGRRSAWKDDPQLRVPAYQSREAQFSDVYSRMSWDKPAPTITTRFNSFSNGRFGHPEESRAISLREGATLQTFPKTFCFFGSTLGIAKQIGNAVPPKFAIKIGKHIINNCIPKYGHE